MELSGQHPHRGAGTRQGPGAGPAGHGAGAAAFPAVDLLTYHYSFAGGWNSVVQRRYNNPDDFGANALFIDWYSGLSSVDGYSSIRLINTNFHKVMAPAATWDIAMSTRQTISSPYSRARSQLVLCGQPGPSDPVRVDRRGVVDQPVRRRQATGRGGGAAGGDGEVGDRRGVPELRLPGHPLVRLRPVRARDAERQHPGRGGLGAADVDHFRPPPGGTSTVSLSGVASDDMAVRSVTWSNDRGGSGAATTTWRVLSGDYLVGYE